MTGVFKRIVAPIPISACPTAEANAPVPPANVYHCPDLAKFELIQKNIALEIASMWLKRELSNFRTRQVFRAFLAVVLVETSLRLSRYQIQPRPNSH